jgi:hypothetical protein
LGHSVAQPLPLGITDECAEFEKDRNDVGTWKDQEKVTLQRAAKPAALAGIHVNDDLADEELSDALSGERVAKKQIDHRDDSVGQRTGVRVDDPARCHEQAVDGRGIHSLGQRRGRVRRRQHQRALQCRKIHQREEESRKHQASEEEARCHVVGPRLERIARTGRRRKSAAHTMSLSRSRMHLTGGRS